jgi:hypothetical protein
MGLNGVYLAVFMAYEKFKTALVKSFFLKLANQIYFLLDLHLLNQTL